MSFFEYYFNEYDFSKKETAVCCPFKHHTTNGIAYKETNPSAHINIENKVFHCKVCGTGKSEVAFISEMLGCTYEEAVRIQKLFENNDDVFTWDDMIKLPDDIKDKVLRLGISEEVIEQLHIGSEHGDEIAFPVFMFGKLVDVRSYRPNSTPKIKSRTGTTTGLIIPYDIWRDSDPNKWTILCAGEKDMAVARSNGFNAITLTGGEEALPKLLNEFKNRRVAICYDNDDAGHRGAIAVAMHIFKYAKEVKVITGFHAICTERGEDVTDFFMKYKGTKDQLVQYIKDTPVFTESDIKEETNRKYPTITLLEASKPQYINRVVKSNIQVVATYENSYVMPTTITCKKLNVTGEAKNNRMLAGEEKVWYFTENTAADLLKLIDNNLTEDAIASNTREIMYISKAEHNIKTSRLTKESVYKCQVTDLFEATSENTNTIEFTAYVLKKKLESGKKYSVTYKLVPHPYKGQQLTMIILEVEEASDSVSNFVIVEEIKRQLDIIKNMSGSVKERIEDLTERVKGLLGYDGYNTLIQAIDLSYHTVLEFNFGTFKNVRGYLDTLIVSESRVGKTTTAEALHRLYGLGHFTSLAGNSATMAGLVGGSNKVNGTYQTRAGVIPQNHRGLIIFEEFAKSNNNIARELTDIKSSNQVRITRVNGVMNLPASVRMITLTNVKCDNSGQSRPISSYPNGIEIIQELIGAPEDIARYDIMLVIGGRGNKTIDPFWTPTKPLSEEVYKTRVRWIWSRTTDQIIITPEMGRYIIDECNKLNEAYDCHIKIFGTEAWKKITRLAIATAGYLVSTDETYEKIIVNQEHIDYAIQFYKDMYDNDTFKLKQYVEIERHYNEIDDEGVELLQEIYTAHPNLLIQLAQTSRSTRNNLTAATGLSNDDFNKVMNRLVRGLFIKFSSFDIVPTERFRKGMNLISRTTRVTRVGEPIA